MGRFVITRLAALIMLLPLLTASCGDGGKAPEKHTPRKPAVSAPGIASGAAAPAANGGTPKPSDDTQSQPATDETHIVRFDNGIAVYLDTDDDRVEVEAKVISGQSRPLEFLVVTPSGADHEALLFMHGRATDLKHGLELLGLREGARKLRFRGDPDQPDGAPIDIQVRWKGTGGRTQTAPIGDWVLNAQTGKPMERSHWVFTGSITFPDTGRVAEALQAEAVGNVIAIWRDPSCVIDNPRESATDDRNWFPNAAAGIPPAMTPVTLVIRPFKATPNPDEPPADAPKDSSPTKDGTPSHD